MGRDCDDSEGADEEGFDEIHYGQLCSVCDADDTRGNRMRLERVTAVDE